MWAPRALRFTSVRFRVPCVSLLFGVLLCASVCLCAMVFFYFPDPPPQPHTPHTTTHNLLEGLVYIK